MVISLEGKIAVGKKVEATQHNEMAAWFGIVYFCQVLFVFFFLFGKPLSFGDSQRGYFFCLSGR